MDMAYMCIRMEQNTRDTGKKTFNMDKELKAGLTHPSSRESTGKVARMDLGSIFGPMEQFMKVNGRKMR